VSNYEVDLRTLAREANAYANLVGRITDSYDKEHRDNFRYEFVQNAIRPALSFYQGIGNEFKGVRNKAYFNLGEKAEAKKEYFEAFFFYNDVYRLEVFGCSAPNATPENCSRLAAEVKMRRILNIEGVPPYTHWRSGG